MATRHTKAPEGFLSSRVALDAGEPDLIRAIQFVFGLDDNDVVAWGLMSLFRWARTDQRIKEVLAQRDASIDQHGPVAGLFETMRAALADGEEST